LVVLRQLEALDLVVVILVPSFKCCNPIYIAINHHTIARVIFIPNDLGFIVNKQRKKQITIQVYDHVER
jgi:hypothetical protein